ncbi:hypothetical protein [Ochrovirga pacifica]|uniref:hypothetical protein n=1 Tax=Ochrovirga pacifica TaxID=1042376 RepID=UPI00025597F0|nr:hypothetical protein [Ochrovirga pacifica]
MKRIFYLLTLSALLFACSNDDEFNFPKFHLEFLPIDEIDLPQTLEVDKDTLIDFKYTLKNGCYYYDNLYRKANDTASTNITLAVVAYVDDDAETCSEETREEENTFSMRLSKKEDYLFKIYKGTDTDGNDVFEEITVSVVDPEETAAQ